MAGRRDDAMLIKEYEQLVPKEEQELDLEAFGFTDSRKQRCAKDEERQLLCVWGEESGLALWRLSGEKLFDLPGAYAAAMFAPGQDVLWAVLRLDDEHLECQVIEFQGALLAKLPMEDEIFRSYFMLTPVPQTDHVDLSFGGGQDGAKDVFLRCEAGVIQIVAEFCKGYAACALCFAADGSEFLAREDSGELLRCSYPSLELLGTFEPPKENWQTAFVAFYVDKNRAVIGNELAWRWFVLNLKTMEIAEEIEVAGHLPKEDDVGVMSTDVENMSPGGGKLRMSIYGGYKQPRNILLAEWPF